MHALIDADIFLYSFGSAKGDNGAPAPWPFIISRLDAQLNNILEAVEADSHQLYVTGPGNYRESVATIKPYKGHRPSEKPYWHEHLKKFLIAHRGAELIEGKEADDALGIYQSTGVDMAKSRYSSYIEDDPIEEEMLGSFDESNWLAETVICSQDKDLHMIPGWHYSWPVGNRPAKELWWQDEQSAIRCFFSQLLTGDSTDNIPGLFGVGGSSTLVKRLSSYTTELEMYISVAEEYEKRFGSYWRQFLTENAQLLWILRTDNTNEVVEKIDVWENSRLMRG